MIFQIIGVIRQRFFYVRRGFGIRNAAKRPARGKCGVLKPFTDAPLTCVIGGESYAPAGKFFVQIRQIIAAKADIGFRIGDLACSMRFLQLLAQPCKGAWHQLHEPHCTRAGARVLAKIAFRADHGKDHGVRYVKFGRSRAYKRHQGAFAPFGHNTVVATDQIKQGSKKKTQKNKRF